MTCPKRKYPKTRKLKRRSHDALTKPAVVLCTQCKHPTRSHAVCRNCGYYRGRMVIDVSKRDKANAA